MAATSVIRSFAFGSMRTARPTENYVSIPTSRARIAANSVVDDRWFAILTSVQNPTFAVQMMEPD
jgi:hypothetical protein